MKAKNEYRPGDVPNKPGIYQFYDQFRTVIYIGKAKSLRKRMSTYFQPSRLRTADAKLRSLVNSICFYSYHEVRNEKESLLLESRLIKEYSPRFNVLMRDDKRFLMLRIDLSMEFPKFQLVRLRRDDGATYFGPFPIAGALRDTMGFLTRHFGLRSCAASRPDEDDFKHCNADVIRRCTAPCVGRISPEDYRSRVDAMLKMITGSVSELLEDLDKQMRDAAAAKRFEKAAKLRDVVTNVKKVFGEPVRNFRHGPHREYAGDVGVQELKEALELPSLPARIECFDISNIMGTFTVASMVSFCDGRPEKSDYRHYRIRTVEGIDDFASMREVVFRRYRRLVEAGATLPDLVVVDGGVGQLNVAMETLVHLGIDDRVALASLAKREEEVYRPGRKGPLILDRHSAGLRLLQAIRDEAHRFAISYNRDLRSKRIMDSLLDSIPGVGAKRKKQLLKTFGSVKTLRKYDAEDIIRRCPGIGVELANLIVEYLSRKK
jgi:excinuclease ABC subunit C